MQVSVNLAQSLLAKSLRFGDVPGLAWTGERKWTKRLACCAPTRLPGKESTMARVTKAPPPVASEGDSNGLTEAPAEVPKKGRKSAKRDKEKYVRLSLDVPLELNFRLSGRADIKKKHKGALALELLDLKLRDYKEDAHLRSCYTEITRQGGETT
jgi:hypothetical protein